MWTTLSSTVGTLCEPLCAKCPGKSCYVFGRTEVIFREAGTFLTVDTRPLSSEW